MAQRLKVAGVSNLYMSFDGTSPRTNPKNHWEAPYAIEACKRAGIGVVLVPTVIKGINDHELGSIIDFGHKNLGTVHAVNFQPVSLTGRMTATERGKYRITIPDCIKRIEEQTNGEITSEGWFPVPSCSPLTSFIEAFTKKEQYELSIHFACGAGTYVFEDADTKKLVPLTNFVDIQGLVEYLEEKTDEIYSGTNRYLIAAKVLTQINSFVNREKQPRGLSFGKMITNALIRHDYAAIGDFHLKSMFLGMMHFQDKYNQDEERLQRCDIHYLTPDLRIIPFCSFNVIPEWYRDKVQQKFGMPIDAWEKKVGQQARGRTLQGHPEARRPRCRLRLCLGRERRRDPHPANHRHLK